VSALSGATALASPPAADVVLSGRDLWVEYRGERPTMAVRGVSLEVGRGEVVGIAGESGCGKSTLAYALCGLLRPPARLVRGSVEVRGEGGVVDLSRLEGEALRRFRWERVAIVFQSAMNALNPVVRIADQFDDIYLSHRPEMTREQMRARSVELLEKVGLDGRWLRAYAHELSGGMRQRVLIAMALALDPEVLVLDEPTTALDVVVQREILEEIQRLRDELNFSIVFITHDLSLLLEMCDRLVVMYAGQVVETGPADALRLGAAHPYTAGLMASFPSIHGNDRVLRGIPGSPPSLAGEIVGCAFAERCAYAGDVCRREEPLLAPVADTVLPEAAVASSERSSGELSPSAPPRALGPRAAACHLYGPESASLHRHESLAASRLDVDGLQPGPSGGTGQATLVAEGVRVVFGRGPGRVRAVDDVDFSVRSGEAVGLVGESGSGKSTLMRALAGLERIDGGQVRLELGDATDRARGRRSVQLVLQDPFASLNPMHSVGYQVGRAVKLAHPRWRRRQVAARVRELFTEVRLVPADDVVGKHPHELSGGQRQRVAIARALAADPAIILADEPVSMLDVSVRLGVLNLLSELVEQRGVGVVYVTHDIATARYFCERVSVLYRGRVVEEGPADAVIGAPRHPYTQLLVDCSPDPGRERRERVRGTGASLGLGGTWEGGCAFRSRCPIARPVCATTTPELIAPIGGVRTRCWAVEEAAGDRAAAASGA